jgi:two-component system, OmpR family, alkaline phosphatase synthesis response regulator PhoP
MTKPAIRVLVIEDDELLREIYATKLKMEGFQVYTATNGLEGLGKAREINPRIILVDMLMPKMTGLEFLQAVKSQAVSRTATMVVISNKSSPHDINQAKTMGARDYLIKSQFTPHDIVAKVHQYLDDTGG